jgi:hypothetical protein
MVSKAFDEEGVWNVIEVGRKLKQPMSGMRIFRKYSALSCTNSYTGES